MNKKTLVNRCFFIRQSEAHGEYADEQLATVQKRMFLIEFLPSRLVIVYQGNKNTGEPVFLQGKVEKTTKLFHNITVGQVLLV